MPKQRFDWRLAVVLGVAGTVFIAAVLFVRNWQSSAGAAPKAAAIAPVDR